MEIDNQPIKRNDAPLTLMGKRLTRKFLGSEKPTNTQEKKELQAYLKGQTHYNYKNTRHEVRQEYKYI